MCTKLLDMKRDYKYFVIQFLEPPESVQDHVYVPSKWVRDFDVEKEIAQVAYPTEDYMITEELVKNNENVGESTRVWCAWLVYGCDSHQNAQQILEEILNNKSKQKMGDKLRTTSEAQKMDENFTTNKQTQNYNLFKKRLMPLDSTQVLVSIPMKKLKPLSEVNQTQIDAPIPSTSKEKITIQISKTESGKYAIKTKENTNKNEKTNEDGKSFLDETMIINDGINMIYKIMQQFTTTLNENVSKLNKVLSSVEDLVALRESDGLIDSDSTSDDNDKNDVDSDNSNEDDDSDNNSINDNVDDINAADEEEVGDDDDNYDDNSSYEEEMTSDKDDQEETSRTTSKLQYSDNKWTLRYQKNDLDTTELVRGSGIYVSKKFLQESIYTADTILGLTKMLCYEVFTEEAVSTCFLQSQKVPLLPDAAVPAVLDCDGVKAIVDVEKQFFKVKSDNIIRRNISKVLYIARQKQRKSN